MSAYTSIKELLAEDPSKQNTIDEMQRIIRELKQEDYVGTAQVYGKEWIAVKFIHPSNGRQYLFALSKTESGELIIGAMAENLEKLTEVLKGQNWA